MEGGCGLHEKLEMNTRTTFVAGIGAFFLVVMGAGPSGGPHGSSKGETYMAVEAKITDTKQSPYAMLDSIGVNRVTITGGFWKPKRDTNRISTIPHQYAECERTGRIDNFRRAAGRPTLYPYMHYTGLWGITAKQPGHSIFAGLDTTIYLVSPGLPTYDECCYWDDPGAIHGAWLADWERPGNKVVCAEYTHGKSTIIVIGTGAYFWRDEQRGNVYRGNLERLTTNVLSYLGGTPTAFLGTATAPDALDAEQLAAFDWLRQSQGAKYVAVADLVRNPERLKTFRTLWWHLTSKPDLPPETTDAAFVQKILEFLDSGGGLLLTGFAPQYVTVLGLEPTPPTTIRQVPKDGFRGIYFNDSDVYKWIEAAAYSLASDADPALDRQLDDIIELIGAAQGHDGYLNTYFMFENEAKRWTDLPNMHELYLGGHMIQGAIAHRRATGKTAFLDIACRWADHICRRFGPGKYPGAPGHPEVEMALVELYRETGVRDYLDLAAFFLEQRGRSVLNGSPYIQDHAPIRAQTSVTGHAVRQLYLCSGVADVYAETGDASLFETLQKQHADFTQTKLYVTGGAGARHEGESFGDPYELPNETAYAETCAAIASFMWNWRMLQITGEARYADEMERALYNGILSGVSLDGREYFYVNPLENRGDHRRTTRHFDGCACCPPNIARTLAALPGYLYGTSKQNDLYIHQYAQSVAEADLGGHAVRLVQETEYPWDGDVTVRIETQMPLKFTLFLRYPGWAQHVKVYVNGKPIRVGARPNEYIAVRRRWKRGDSVKIGIPMPVERIIANPHVQTNIGRVALRRGPVVYCIEQADQPAVDLRTVAIPLRPRFECTYCDAVLGGVTLLEFQAVRSLDAKVLYAPWNSLAVSPSDQISIRAIPYYAWANREPGPMCVWIPQFMR